MAPDLAMALSIESHEFSSDGVTEELDCAIRPMRLCDEIVSIRRLQQLLVRSPRRNDGVQMIP